MDDPFITPRKGERDVYGLFAEQNGEWVLIPSTPPKPPTFWSRLRDWFRREECFDEES
jgi:hypothetical protein